MTTVPPLSQSAALEQRTFRSLLAAMSMPGTIETVSTARAEDGTWAGIIAIAQALLDHEVTFYVAADGGTVAEDAILRRTGARTAPLERAGYVFADAARATSAVEYAVEGDLEEPERSATVVLLCTNVGEGNLALRLTGPGVDGEAMLHVGGLDASVVKARAERNWPFPTGIDVILVDHQGRIAGLPRSTQIELMTSTAAGSPASDSANNPRGDA